MRNSAAVAAAATLAGGLFVPAVHAAENSTIKIGLVGCGGRGGGAAKNALGADANVKLVATTLREVHSTNRHDWAAVLWLDGQRYVSPTLHLDVVDRIGGGDGFASGLISGLISGRSPEDSLRLGWAHGALLTTFPGDTTMATLAEVRAFATGGSARIQR